MNAAIVILNLIVIAYLYLVASRKMIKALLALISIYILMLPLFIFLQYDFIGLILVLLYVGAVSVFFLFVLMTTKLDEQPERRGLKWEEVSWVVWLICGVLTVYNLVLVLGDPFNIKLVLRDVDAFMLTGEVSSGNGIYLNKHFVENSPLLDQTSNILNIGTGVYVHFGLELLCLGILLFASAVGAMFFTKETRR